MKKIILVVAFSLIPQFAFCQYQPPGGLFSGAAGGAAFGRGWDEADRQRREAQIHQLEMQRQQQEMEMQRREHELRMREYELQRQREELRFQQEEAEFRQQQQAKLNGVKLINATAQVDLYEDGTFSEPFDVLITCKNRIVSIYRTTDKAFITSGKYTKKVKGTIKIYDEYNKPWKIRVK